MNINMRSIILIGIALVVAGVTAMLARSLVGTPAPQQAGPQQAAVKAPEAKMKILVAAADMKVGHFIKASNLVWQSWPDGKVHDSYIRKDAEITPESFVGAVVNSAISAGEPILENRLVKPGNRGFMAAVLPAGKRAISIRITATTGNAGFVFPGDKVDILLTHQVNIKSNDRKKARVSETVLSNIRVLAINQRTDNPTHTPSIGQTATLEVTAKEAEKISLIKNMGELTLILRSLGTNGEDNALQAANDVRTVTWDSDVSQQLSVGSKGASSGGNFSVEVFRGGMKKSQTVNFNQLLFQALKSGNSKTEEQDPEESEE
ncbi:Flp pilus assembly protein RcpC/CpaB [hydrothermal vent metagenome]|uniref:Flp pilus assembly protein RcpC/CpaB n=1 Tax=hydrothermal vent metagenome TaxID=652676 RepID=A0A3B0RYC2_9ZZZZ